ncbi:hypothetical protein L7F22_066578 [Adiantum nelumboides]|nr:hypothetical protein [Adiantum nelumboides]
MRCVSDVVKMVVVVTMMCGCCANLVDAQGPPPPGPPDAALAPPATNATEIDNGAEIAVRGQAPEGKTWCVATSTAEPENLQAALDFVCGVDPAFCQPLQTGQRCFYPNTLYAHASFAFNAYWQARKSQPNTTCDFGGNAVIAIADPSYPGTGCTFD